MTLEPEVLLTRAEARSKQWDRCVQALMRKDYRAFDHEMARFWMMSNSTPREAGTAQQAPAINK